MSCRNVFYHGEHGGHRVDINDITESVIGAAIAVHRELGPGLLESSYEACLAYELLCRDLPYERQKAIPLVYRGIAVESAYRIDFFVGGKVIVELKAVERLDPVHVAQVLTYLKLSRCRIGLLINFNVTLLKDGIRRLAL